MKVLNRFRRLAVTASVLVLFVASHASAQQAPAAEGSRVRVQLNWGDKYQGTLLQWSADSVYVHPENWSGPVRLPASGIKSVQRSLGSGSMHTAVRQGAYGTLAGLAFGLIVGAYDQSRDKRNGNMGGMVVAFSGAGFLVGWINGFTSERWQPVFPVQ